MTKAFLTVLAVASSIAVRARAEEPASQWVILNVGLVRVAPTRPGTDQPWTKVIEKPKRSGCGTVGAVMGLVTPGWSIVANALCDDSASTKVLKHASTDPDVFVRMRAGSKASFRSHTIRNTLSHNFDFSVLVPVQAIPRSGLEITVLVDDDTNSEDSQETIGSFHLSAAKIQAAVADGEVLKLSDGSVESLELLANYPDSTSPILAKKSLRANVQASVMSSTEAIAGQVVEFKARGHQIAQGRPDGNRQIFPGFPLGTPVAFVGKKGLVQKVAVEDCAMLLSKYGGTIAVGVNDRKPDANMGTIDFAAKVRNPSPQEWLGGGGALACPSSGEADSIVDRKWATKAIRRVNAYFGSKGEDIAAAIQMITHPSGKRPSIGNISATADDDRVVVQIPVSWSGGLIGGQYETLVVWDFYEARHNASVVSRDSSPTHVAKKNAQELDEFFRAKVFPAISNSR
jgi:hypothetical protein